MGFKHQKGGGGRERESKRKRDGGCWRINVGACLKGERAVALQVWHIECPHGPWVWLDMPIPLHIFFYYQRQLVAVRRINWVQGLNPMYYLYIYIN